MLRALPFLVAAMIVALAGCASQPRVDERFVETLNAPYRLDSGDELRVVVFGQESLTNVYSVEDSGRISMPLVGMVEARGRTVQELESAIARALANGYLRNPSVSVQVQTYRPFFILGEVNSPGQYSYVTGLTGKTAAAIAGGFTPRARTGTIRVQRTIDGRIVESDVPVNYPIAPGDTIHVQERWF